MKDEGFSLAELLVAALLSLAVIGAALALIDLTELASQALPVATDMAQRARVAADALAADLRMAGAGPDGGPLAGPLSQHFAAVVPRRLGLLNADPATTASNQVISITYVPRTLAQTTTSTALTPGGSNLQVVPQSNCPSSQALCGLTSGMGVLVFDALDHFDLFTLTGVQGNTGHTLHRAQVPAIGYAAGAVVTEVEMRTYYYDAVNHQLRQYDGYQTDVPVVDHVAGLDFVYFGDPNPPVAPVPPVGVETCLYDVTGAPKPLTTLPAQSGSLVPLPIAMFADGPWCGAGSGLFDADLLRIRQIRVTIRLEAAAPSSWVVGPYVLTFDVVPRNLNLR